MKETRLGFEYSWDDLAPIRPLCVTVIAFQILGAIFCVWVDAFASRGGNVCLGAALASFPGFLFGYVVQGIFGSGALSENRTMVWRCALVALFVSVIGFVVAIQVAG